MASLEGANLSFLARLCGSSQGPSPASLLRREVLEFSGWAHNPDAAAANKWASLDSQTQHMRVMYNARPRIAAVLTALGLSDQGDKSVLATRLLAFVADPFRPCPPPVPAPKRRRVGAPAGPSGAARTSPSLLGIGGGRGSSGGRGGARPTSLPSLHARGSAGALSSEPPRRVPGSLVGLAPPRRTSGGVAAAPPLRRRSTGTSSPMLRPEVPAAPHAAVWGPASLLPPGCLDHPFLNWESVFGRPQGPPLSKPVVVLGTDLLLPPPARAMLTFPTPPAAELGDAGAAAGTNPVQVVLRCLRVAGSSPITKWKQKWPYGVVAYVNGYDKGVAKGVSSDYDRTLGPDDTEDVTGCLFPSPLPLGAGAAGGDAPFDRDLAAGSFMNEVVLQSAAVDELDVKLLNQRSKEVYLLFSQRVRTVSDSDLIRDVRAQTVRHVERLRAKHRVPRVGTNGAATTPLDVAIADLRASLCDDGLEIDATPVSLRCPLSMGRLGIPVKGVKCQHLQCFDLAQFLSYARRSRLFVCPVCNSDQAAIGQLWVSPLVEKALRDFPETLADDVQVAADGTMKPLVKKSAAPVAPAAGAAAPAATVKIARARSRFIAVGCVDLENGCGGGVSGSSSGMGAAAAPFAGKASPASSPLNGAWDPLLFIEGGTSATAGCGGGAAGGAMPVGYGGESALPPGICTPAREPLPMEVSTPPPAALPLGLAPVGPTFIDLTGDSEDESPAAMSTPAVPAPASADPSLYVLMHPESDYAMTPAPPTVPPIPPLPAAVSAPLPPSLTPPPSLPPCPTARCAAPPVYNAGGAIDPACSHRASSWGPSDLLAGLNGEFSAGADGGDGRGGPVGTGLAPLDRHVVGDPALLSPVSSSTGAFAGASGFGTVGLPLSDTLGGHDLPVQLAPLSGGRASSGSAGNGGGIGAGGGGSGGGGGGGAGHLAGGLVAPLPSVREVASLPSTRVGGAPPPPPPRNLAIGSLVLPPELPSLLGDVLPPLRAGDHPLSTSASLPGGFSASAPVASSNGYAVPNTTSLLDFLVHPPVARPAGLHVPLRPEVPLGGYLPAPVQAPVRADGFSSLPSWPDSPVAVAHPSAPPSLQRPSATTSFGHRVLPPPADDTRASEGGCADRRSAWWGNGGGAARGL
ncbi:hypothetical protein BU14_0166s0028 [Porphyra umbilicalis]|uniref:SP-RING-type domain-containing protein n=1 Tax=Porphyra umbilicalis TaxID=2786 RepID=A0A1X6P811_PORUM|nr:hypothetical protein BU14_0166s0028 [Porphyra umbilicalis]|eukprot:OSX76988.1 hypothetical protein BU14_0166s0028 [Porphyra umbilicalis]